MNSENREKRVSHLRTMRLFTGTEGERIEEGTLVNSETLEPLSEAEYQSLNIEQPLVVYIGVVSVVNGIMQPTGTIGIPCDVRFMIPGATNPAEALANFEQGVNELKKRMEEQQEKAMQQMREQQSQEQLVIPNADESKAINDHLKLHVPD